jgi:hypothetical protein
MLLRRNRMKLELPTRGLLLVCFLSAPLLAGADGGCGAGQVAIGGDRQDAGTGNGAACGRVTCAAGQVCCNASCGICTEPGGACDMMFCQDPCAAQDARGEGACDMALGYKWDGGACALVGGCSCQGSDCGALFPSQEACSSAHDDCPLSVGCELQQQNAYNFINENKACSSTADCRIDFVGCGVTEDDCTGAVYVNQSTDLAQLGALRAEVAACVGGGQGCAVCLRISPSAACVDGLCQPGGFGSACEDEQQAMRNFIQANKACSTVEDCQTQYAGSCSVTEDGCTGAVYVNQSTDLNTLSGLVGSLRVCEGDDSSCACERASLPPACVSGQCQPGSF